MLRRLITQIDDHLRSQKGNAASKANGGKAARELDVLALEDRILYSAVPMVQAGEAPPQPEVGTTAFNDVFEAADQSDAGSGSVESPEQFSQGTTNFAATTDANQAAGQAETESANDVSRELIFVDTSVEDFQQLLDDIVAQGDPSRQIEIVFVDPTRDGVQQISEALAGRSNIDALHVVSHGSQGQVQLGATLLTNQSLLAYSNQLSGWADSLTADAELSVYGCELANCDEGRSLLESLQELTGAEIASLSQSDPAEMASGLADSQTNGYTNDFIVIGNTNDGIDIGAESMTTIGLDPDAGTALVRRELVILDPAVQNSAALRELLLSQVDVGRNLELFVLDSQRDGIQQIAEILARYQDLDAVHILSHGSDLGLQLGSTWLDSQSINGYSAEIQSWQNAFSASGDLLLYGCDLAANNDGRMLVDTLGLWTTTDVAASTDLTGYSMFLGDWELEYQYGDLETGVVASELVQAEWQGLMAVSLNSTSSANTAGTASSLTWSHTIASGSNRILTVSINLTGGQSTGVTYGGVAMTLVGRQTGIHSHTSEIWQLLTPSVGSANIVASFNTTTDALGGGIAFNDVDQTSPTGTFQGASADSGTASVTVTSAVGDMVIDTLYVDQGTAVTALSGQTEAWERTNARTGAGSTEAGAASVVMSWTISSPDEWNIAAVSIRQHVNDAPVLDNSGAMTLMSITEDQTSNAGQTVASIIASAGGDRITDVDSGAVEGIAITGLTSGNGSWQYSVNGGTSWQNVGSVSASSALLLRNTDSLRFIPNGTAGTTADVTFRAWDQTSGTVGTRADVTTSGGTTAFSTAEETASIVVSNVNDQPSFASGDGMISPGFSSAIDTIYSMTVQSDGKILAVGASSASGTNDFAIARFNADGTIDTSFGGGDGYVTTSFGTFDDLARSVNVLADGRILVVGTTYTGTSHDMALAQYNSDGTLDSSFGGGDGLATSGNSSNDEAYSATIQSDGKILVAGKYNANNFGLLRFNSNGSLDTTFGASGVVSTDIAGSNDGAYSIALQNDGKIVLGGFAFTGVSFDFATVRYNADGTLDTTFSGDGKATIDLGTNSSDTGYGLTLQADNKILIAGWSDAAGTNDFALVRLNTDGSLDTTFSGDGKLTTAIGSGSDLGASVATQADGKILVVGNSSSNSGNFGVVRYNLDGSLDTSFGTSGVVDTNFGGSSQESVYAVFVQSDGKILVGGSTTLAGNVDFAVARYSSSGSLDTRFDLAGTLGGSVNHTEGGVAVVLDSNVSIFDDELTTASNFNGATLTLARNGGANADDVFSASGTLSLSGGNVIVGATTIGTFTNVGGTLAITFNSNATNTLVNSAMQQIAYSNSSDTPSSSALINWTFNDGNTGSQGTGGALSANGSVTVNITAVNDTPDVVGPGSAYTVNEQTNLNIHGSGFSVTDLDAASGTVIATIAVGEGAITVAAGNSGVAISGGNGTGSVTLTGTLAQINNLLTGGGTGTIVYINSSNTPSASTTITVTVNDGGNTGTDPGLTGDGSSEQDSASQTINLSALNDDPTNAGSLTSDITVTEDIASNVDLSAVDFSDVDAGSSNLTVTLTTATGGQLTASTAGGVTVGGTATARTFTGTLANLNTYFNTASNITYLHSTPHLNGNNADTITVVINDNGNTGSGGGANQTLGTVNVDISAVNDDPTFGVGNGWVATNFGSTDYSYAVAVQADGKFLLAGSASIGSNDDFALARYNIDGTLDTSFGVGGKVTTDFAGSTDWAHGVVVQSDGKIVVTGRASIGGNYDVAVVRYNTDGSLDTSFGGTGKVTVDFSSGNDVGNMLELQTDGKIVVSARARIAGTDDFAVLRFNTDGTLDTSLGGTGKVTTAIGAGHESGQRLTIQTDGKIVVAGYSSNGSNNDFAVVRYNSDGSLDTGFGGTGKVTTAIGTGADSGGGVAVQADGKIVVGGATHNGTDNDVAVVRYNADGTLDTSFGGTGKVTTAIGTSNDQAAGLRIQSDGKIVVGGTATIAGSQDFAAVRYNTDGSLDNTFGTGGITTVAAGTGTDYALEMALQADGKILLAGRSYNGTNDDFAVVRLGTNGTLDTSFSQNILNGQPTYVEGGTPVILDSDVQIFDVELSAADNFNGATLTLSRNGGASTEDTFSATGNLLALTEGGNLVLSGVSIGTVNTNSSGTLLLSFNGNATQARVNETLQSIAYANTNDAPPTSVQVNWIFSDGNTGSQGSGGAQTATGSVTVNITDINDAPVQASIEGTALSYAESSGAVAITSSITISDLDDSNLESAVVAITGNYVNGQDVLSFTNQNGISGSWNATSGELTLTGSATLAQYQTALRSITYTNSSDNPNTATRTVSFTVNDGDSSSNTQSRNIAITAANDAPVLDNTGNMTLTAITEDQTANGGQTVASIISSAGGDRITDPDGSVAEGIAITATTNGNGSWEYSLNGSTWLAVNSVADNSALLLRSTDYLRFVPNGQNATMGDISFRAWDQTGATAGQQGTKVNVSTNGDTTAFSSATEVASITVTAVPDVPQANDDDGHVSFDGTDDVVVIADSASLTMTNTVTMEAWINPVSSAATARMIINKEGEYEVAVFADNTLRWAFANTTPGWTWVNTGVVISNNVWTHIAVTYDNGNIVTHVNGNLVHSYAGSGPIGDSHATLDELRIGGRLSNPSTQYYAGSIDDVRIWNVARSQAEIQASLDQTLVGNETGLVGYYRFNQASGTTVTDLSSFGNHGVLTGGVTRVNYSTDEETALAVSVANGVLANDRDGDGDALTVTALNGNGGAIGSATAITSGALVTLNGNGSFTFNANGAFNYLTTGASATDSFTYTVSDGTGNTSTSTVVIHITGVNDAPVEASIEGTSLSYTENAGAVAITSSIAISDLDDTNIESAVVAITGNYVNGQDVLSFTNQNGISGSWNTTTGELTLTGSATLAQYQTALRSVTYTNSSGSPNPATRTVSFTINDGDDNSNTQTRDIAITSDNDAPVQASIEGTALSYTENAGAIAITSSITISDVDDSNLESAVVAITGNYVNGQDVLSFTNQNGISGSWNATTGELTLSGSATLAQYEAALRSMSYINSSDNPNTAMRTVSFTVNDGDDNSNLQSRDIALTAVNDAPVAVDKLAQVLAGQSITVSAANGLLVDASDLDGNPLTAVLIAGPVSGSLTLNSDGSWNYTPTPGFYGDVTFSYAANDGSVDSSAATVTIQVAIGGFAPPPPPDPTSESESESESGSDSESESESESDSESEASQLFAAQTSDLEYASSANNSTVVSERSSTDKLDSTLPSNNTDLKSATGIQQENTDDELQLYSSLLFNGQFKPYSQKLMMLAEISDESARMNFIIDRSDLQFSMNQFRSMEDDRLATLNLVHGTVTTLFVGASAGIAAWCVGGSYLISIVASSMPTWSGFDVIHVVNHPTRIKGSDDESVAQIISSGPQSQSIS